MPRILSDDPNELKIHDNISGSDIVLHYRMPSTAERAAYANESFQRRGRKIKAAIGETRIKYGLKILQGIREGDFETDTGRPLSSTFGSEFYDEGWKEKIAKHAADLVELLAVRVFDAPAILDAEDEEDEADEDAEKN